MCLVMCSMYIFCMDKVLELLSGGSGINGAYPVYFLLEDPFNRAGAQTFPVVSLWDTAGDRCPGESKQFTRTVQLRLKLDLFLDGVAAAVLGPD